MAVSAAIDEGSETARRRGVVVIECGARPSTARVDQDDRSRTGISRPCSAVRCRVLAGERSHHRQIIVREAAVRLPVRAGCAVWCAISKLTAVVHVESAESGCCGDER